jgi:hypothetical protein
MFVDRKEIRLGSIKGSATTINIPIKLDFTPVDNSELVRYKWVEDEVEKAINPITDYKKVRFKPAVVNPSTQEWTVVDEWKIILNFFTKKSIKLGTPQYDTTNIGKYGDIGFSTEDLFCRVSRLINSFLSLNFYDTPNPTSNNLITFSNIFTQILDEQKDPYGIPLPSSECPISYRIGDPTLKPDTIHEGFHLYWFEDLVKESPNQEYVMYLSPTFQNANNGESSIMYPVKTTLNAQNKANILLRDISGEGGSLYIKTVLKYDTTDNTFKYTFMDNDNVNQLSSNGGINMSAVDTDGSPLPTITLWQLAPNGEV